MDCVTEEQVLGFLRHSLDAEQRAAIERHLDQCPECLELVTLAGKPSLVRESANTMPGHGAARAEIDHRGLVTVDPDRYVLGPEIARGGMGRITAARDRRL